MSAIVLIKGVSRALKFVVYNLLAGILSIVITSITNLVLLAVLLIRFIVMNILRSAGGVIRFVGNTSLNTISFVRDTLFSILTFIVQTIVNTILFVLNQLVMIWSLLIRLISIGLGETCFLARNGFQRLIDTVKDFGLVLRSFVNGIPGLISVIKAQQTDILSSDIGITTMIKQTLLVFNDALMYILKGNKDSYKDGIVPNVLMETFKSVPLTYDLGKLVLTSTYDITNEIFSSIYDVFGTLVNLNEIKLGCQGKVNLT